MLFHYLNDKKMNLKKIATITAILMVLVIIPLPPLYGQDIVGKLITGYQGWFSCGGDDSPLDDWVHWAQGSSWPRPGYASFDLYPDMSEYYFKYQTGFANFGNGYPATLFSSYDAQVVNKHLEWMEEYGIDVAALQRFGHSLPKSKHKGHKDGIATMIKNAAETYNRKFYIMYDISDWDNFQSEIKTDWTNTITASLDLLSSPAYAKENGKPVVCVWGIGSSGRPGDQSSWTDVITWLKAQGCYVIAGAVKNWLTEDDVRAACENADMISPWHVGTFSLTGVNSWGDRIAADMMHCKNLEIDYMPVLWPGFSWANWKDGYEDRPNHHPRMHGEFMWEQFYTARRKFDWVEMIPTAYVAMFDEYDESTAIAKAAEDASMIPTDQWFLTLDADGVHCSSDFYLRLTGDGAKMLKDQIGLTSIHPTPHTIEPTPPGVYPAEEAYLSGPTFSEYYSKYNGEGYVEFNNPSGDFIEWTVNVPSAEEYILNFRYSLKDTINRPLELKVNDLIVVDSLDFPVTSYWTVWQSVSISLTLNAGDNTIRLSSIGLSGSNIDELVLLSYNDPANEVLYDDFEGDTYGNWNDGGYHCKVDSNEYAHQGDYSINLERNASTSMTTTSDLALSYYNAIIIEFWAMAVSMESGESFLLQISTDGGQNYTTIKTWVSGVDFENDIFFEESLTIVGFKLTDQTRLRFRCNADAEDDDIYLDEIRISARNVLTGMKDISVERLNIQNYPNPFHAETKIIYNIEDDSYVSLYIYDLQGKMVDCLLENEFHVPGRYSKIWNPGDINLSGNFYISVIHSVSREYSSVFRKK
jgi:archaellin